MTSGKNLWGAGAVLRARRPGLRSGRRGGAGGFTLLEVMFSAAVIAIAISGVAGALVSAMRLDQVNSESSDAQQAARQMMERVSSQDWEEVWQLFNTDPNDDPGGPGTAPGPDFLVPELTVQDGDLDGFVGEVRFPDLNFGGALQLREDFVDPDLGMPSDLNADGNIDTLDHSGDFQLLPVQVRIRWKGVSGPRTLDLETVITDR